MRQYLLELVLYMISCGFGRFFEVCLLGFPIYIQWVLTVGYQLIAVGIAACAEYVRNHRGVSNPDFCYCVSQIGVRNPSNNNETRQLKSSAVDGKNA